jgi:hypothetical protein
MKPDYKDIYNNIKNVDLQGPYPLKNTIQSSTLWKKQPCVILVIRRLG